MILNFFFDCNISVYENEKKGRYMYYVYKNMIMGNLLFLCYYFYIILDVSENKFLFCCFKFFNLFILLLCDELKMDLFE